MASRVSLPELEAISRYRDVIENELANDVIDYGDEPCLRAIHVVARAGEVKIARMLLERKANPNFTTSKGLSPLHYGVLSGKVSMVRLLLLFGAQINYQSTRDGRSALFTAAEKGHLDVAKFLLDHGANPTMRSFNGDLPRDVAFENGYCKIEALLEDHEKRVRRKQMQRPTSDYDIAAYLLGGAVDDPFLEMTRSIDELFPKMSSARRRSADVTGSTGSSACGNSSSSSSESISSNAPHQSGFTRSETFCAAPPIYEDRDYECEESYRISQQATSHSPSPLTGTTIHNPQPPTRTTVNNPQPPLLIDQLWDRPPSYDQVMKSSAPLPVHGPSYSGAVHRPSYSGACTNTLVNLEENPMCREVRGQPVGACSSPSHSDNSYPDHDDDVTPCVYSDRDLLLSGSHDDKDTTALLFEEHSLA